MGSKGSRDIPDLDLPPPRPSSASMPRVQPPAPVSIELGEDNELEMEIERTGAMVSPTPPTSVRSAAPTSNRPVELAARLPPSGLEVTYQRRFAEPAAPAGPTFRERLVAWLVTSLLSLATAALLLKFAHRHGGRNVTSLVPHAFDASSTVQSGAFALGALVLAIALGFTGLKLRPRSYATVGSAAMLLLTSLAMVTVTLVSSEEQPTPPDGALLIPYVVPLAVSLLGLGVAGRGPRLFLDGGARRATALLVSLAGGALVFAGIEIGALAARLP